MGTSAATESITITSTPPERTSMSAISSPCSPVSGCEIEHVADVDAQLAGVDRVERVFRVDVGRDAARLLHLRYDLQAQRRLAGGFRAVDFDDAAARQAAHAQRDVEAERARGDDRQVAGDLGLAHFHDRALAELLFDLQQRGGEGFAFVVVHRWWSWSRGAWSSGLCVG